MKKTTALLLAASLAGLWSGCDHSRTPPNGGAPQKKLRIGFVSRGASDYWSLMPFGCDNAVDTLGGVELDYRTPTGHTPADQDQVLNNVLASGVQAIAISPVDGNAQLAVLNAISTNVTLICVDNDAETLNGISAGEIYGTIAQSPFKIGKSAIASLVKHLGGDQAVLAEGKVLIPSNPVTKENVGAYKNLSTVLAQ